MRLTALTDFALRLLVHVGQYPNRLCTIAEVAQAQQISQTHLMKVTHQLALQGWLTTVRGKGGGMRLAHPPEHIRIGAIVRSMEPCLSIMECFNDHSNCHLAGTCRLGGIMDGALQAFLRHLDQYTLADLLPSAAQSAPASAINKRKNSTSLQGDTQPQPA